MGKSKMINKAISKDTYNKLRQLTFFENKKLYQISEEIFRLFIDENKSILEEEDPKATILSVKIDEKIAKEFAKISKKMGVRQDKLIEKAVDDYIEQNNIKLIKNDELVKNNI